VAWFVVKNELACSDPEQVKTLFEHIERQVKPQIQPFYTTTCPRGHQGRWIDVETGEPVDVDPIDLPPEQRYRYRWEGPEVIYTFWAKHGPCQAKGCGHRTPIFRTPVIAEKNLSTRYIECTCPDCATVFHAELGETRMAPGAERVVIDEPVPFTELSQPFAKLLNDYEKGTVKERFDRCFQLKAMAVDEKWLLCPACGGFSGQHLAKILEYHTDPGTDISKVKKKDYNIQKKKVQMYPNSGLTINAELNNPNFRVKKSVDDILKWYAVVEQDAAIRTAAETAHHLVLRWRAAKDGITDDKQRSVFEILEEAD
jgi:hypothetical protein